MGGGVGCPVQGGGMSRWTNSRWVNVPVQFTYSDGTTKRVDIWWPRQAREQA